MAIQKATYCKLYQEQILETDKTLNAFGVCPKCLWDIADHNHAPQGDYIYYIYIYITITFIIVVVAVIHTID